MSDHFHSINPTTKIILAFLLFLLVPVILKYFIDDPNEKMYYVYAYICWALPALLTYIDASDPVIEHKSDFMENAVRVWAILFALFCVHVITGLEIVSH